MVTTPLLLLLAAAGLSGRAALFVEGPSQREVLDDLTTVLGRSFELVPPDEFAAQLKTQMKQRDAGARGVDVVVAAAGAAEAELVVLAQVSQRRALRLLVVDSEHAQVLADESSVLTRSTSERRRKQSWRLDPEWAESVIKRAMSARPRPEPVVELVAAAPVVIAAPPPAAPVVKKARPVIAELQSGVQLGGRRFAYNDPVTSNLRPYEAMGAPGVSLRLQVYAAAQARHAAFLEDLGLEVAYRQAVGMRSRVADQDGVELDTRFSDWHAGPRWRLRLGGAELGLVVALGELRFTFDDAGDAAFATELPRARYRFLRPAVDARVELGRVSLLATAAYLHLLEPLALGERFARAEAAGVSGEVGLGLGLASVVEARLLASYSRFFHDLHPAPGDRHIAGGATDEIFAVELALAFRVGQ